MYLFYNEITPIYLQMLFLQFFHIQCKTQVKVTLSLYAPQQCVSEQADLHQHRVLQNLQYFKTIGNSTPYIGFCLFYVFYLFQNTIVY